MNYSKKIYSASELSAASDEFKKNGIVFFNEIISSPVFEDATNKINNKLTDNPGKNKLVNLHFTDNWFANFVSRKEFIDIASKLLNVEKVKIYSSLILNKPPKGKMTVPWHQDAAYDWPLKPIDCASLWLALDDVTHENGAMKVAIGAHNKGVFPMEESADLEEGDTFFSNQHEKSIPEKLIEDYKIIDVTMKKSFSSFHHSMLPHCSTPNNTNSRRCAFIIRYCRGDAKLVKFSGMKREDFFRDYELFDPIN